MIAFKEWQIICDACASGRQSILFRKGGIHEGREGFSFKHDQFVFFPTRFHNQQQGVREGSFETLPEWEIGESVTISHFAKVEWAVTLNRWEEVQKLSNHHIWTEETIKERFDWEGKGMATGSIHAALIRVYKLKEPQTFAYEKKHGGCRSWIEAPVEFDENLVDPVLSDDAFAKIQEELKELTV